MTIPFAHGRSVPSHMGYAQEAALAAQMHANSAQIIVLTADDFVSIVADKVRQSPAAAAALRKEISAGDVGQKWKDEVYPNVNDVAWVQPVAEFVADANKIEKTVRAIGIGGLASYVKTHRGKQYIVLKGDPTSRNKLLQGTKFLATNAKMMQLGLGYQGAKGIARGGLVPSIVVSVGIESIDFVLNDQKTMADWFGGVGVELAKGGAAVALGLALTKLSMGGVTAVGIVGGTALAPLVVCAVLILFIGIGLNALDNKFQIKAKVIQVLKDVPQGYMSATMKQAEAFNSLGQSVTGWFRRP
jgi:hypothetical protein